MSNTYTFIQFSESMNFPDGIYNGLYNKEPVVYRIKNGKPVYVQFIEKNSIFDPRGIMISNVELLIPSQNI